ncbi:MAG: type II toxin-antitoxin system VapC family toxin [Candidatus Lokiarchaeota archaeon]|nr:type II toxin-antitoxin system VapC family toxin [Candidatus Lokiarchaeota archaeon]
MPLIDTSTIFSFLNKNSEYHQYATQVMEKISHGKDLINISTVSIVELHFIYKAHGVDEGFEKDLSELRSLRNLTWTSLDVASTLTAMAIKKAYKLSFFNALHAGIAINLDKQIISQDKEFDQIKGLIKIPLLSFLT